MYRLTSCIATVFATVLLTAAPAVAQTADDVIAKNLEAKGGAEVLKRTTSVRMSGEVLAYTPGQPKPQRMTVVVTAKRPNLVRREMTSAGQTVTYGYDGRTAWAGGPNGVQEIRGRQAEGVKADADFDPVFLSYRERGHIVEFVGTEAVDGRQAHHLKVTRKAGPVQHYYLDAATGLEFKVKTDPPADLPAGAQRAVAEMLLSDYRTVDGLTVPFKMRQMLNGELMAEITFDTVAINVPVDDGVFRMPLK